MAKNRRRQLRELYTRVPGIACKGLCHDSCGPIEMSPLEERILNERSVTITPRDEALEIFAREGDFDCDALGEDKRCTVYKDRPLICRLWGVTETLACPYGCEPEAVLSDSDAFALLAEGMTIGGVRDMASPDKIRQALASNQEQLAPWLQAMRPTDQRRST